MSTFHAEYPGEKLKLFETDSEGVIDMILSHHIDIGFPYNRDRERKLQISSIL